MKRALLIVGLTTVGLGLLVWLGGGIAGPGSRESEPAVVAAPEARKREAGLTPVPDLPVDVMEGQGFSVPAETKSVTFTDPTSGEAVEIPDFLPWYISLSRVNPERARRPEEQAARAEGVELITYREPQTLAEARALSEARRAHAVRETLIKWRITAPWARADFLAGDLGLSAPESRPKRADTRVLLGGGVVIRDYAENMTIESETLEIQPYLDEAKGKGRIVVRHEAFELTGTGLDLERKDHGTNVTILQDVFVRLCGGAPSGGGSPKFDFGQHDMKPGRISAEGSARLVHDHRPDAAREQLTLEMVQNVHAQQRADDDGDDGTQGADRTLDAEQLRLYAYRRRTEGGDASPSRAWKLQKLEAEGAVVIEYPERTRDGKPYLIRAEGQSLLHEVGPGGISVTLLEGSPEVTLRGNIPFEGLRRLGRPGLLRASARDRIWLGPAQGIDLPTDADPQEYRRALLIGDAKVEYREAGFDPVEDTIAGDEMRLLLRQIDEARDNGRADPDLDAESTPSRRVVAVSFDVFGEVQVGGTRMSGMTQRLLGRRLDTDTPLLIAEGQGTSFAFHGMRRGERLVGGSEPPPAPAGDVRSEAPAPAGARTPADAKPSPEWVLHRLHARDEVEVRTTLGGAGLGIPARMEGTELTYDRIPDQARMRGTAATPARLFVDTGGEERHRLVARTMTLDRARGTVEADEEVQGEVFLTGGSDGSGGGLALPEPRQGVPTTLGVATNGRIEVHTRLDRTAWAPRAEAEQLIRVEGPLVAELTASTLDEIDTLRARWLEVGLVHTMPAPSDAQTAPTTRVAGQHSGGTGRPGPFGQPRAPGTAKQSASATQPPKRWDIVTEHLTGRFDATGFTSLDAAGGVAFQSEDALVKGTAFAFDATGKRLFVKGGTAGDAWVVFGPPTARSEVRARQFVLTLGEDGPEELLARGPVNAILIREDPGTKGGIERFDFACRGDVMITPTRLTTEGTLVDIQRFLRAAPGAPWTAPFRVWAYGLIVHGRDLMTRNAADVERVIAYGKPRENKFTVLRTGQGKDEMMIWGAKFDLDVHTGLATLDGSPERDLRVRRGPADAPVMESDQTRIVVNMNTGDIEDWDQMHFILRGGMER